MHSAIYQRLIEHLDRLPGGFQKGRFPTWLLARALFTPQEAALAVHLTLEREPSQAIARRAGLSLTEAERRLRRMARKGLLFAVEADGAPALYQAVPFIVGIFEFQVKNRNPLFLLALALYLGSKGSASHAPSLGQLRTVPVAESVNRDLQVLPYERIEVLVQQRERFAVTTCLCRLGSKALLKGCDAPLETCLTFDEWADFYVRTGRGKAIDRAEVLRIIAEADKHNLVLQPSNSQQLAFLCCCCGDCCGVLGELKALPKPAEAVTNDHIATYDADLCVGCRVCLGRCQMDALQPYDGLISFERDRCIGCGLCVSSCPSGALSLMRKPEEERKPVPADMTAAWQEANRRRRALV